MELVADLHIHSKYSRAVSPQMVIPEISKWAKKKGIGLVGTGDWTHPLWLKELQANLEETASGIYKVKSTSEVRFLLSTEISSIYSQGGKLRRIHNLILAPSFEIVEKINETLKKRGANLLSDGRPIIGLSAENLAELVLGVDEKCLVIPAHCLLPTEVIHVRNGIKKISEIKKGDMVYTHRNRFKKVNEVFTRLFKGKIYRIIPEYFRLGINVTEEHPFWAIRTKKNCPSVNRNFGICKPLCSQLKKCCARRHFEKYRPQWIKAGVLEKGDVLLFPRFIKTVDKKFFLLSDICKNFKLKQRKVLVAGSRTIGIPQKIPINTDFCRLAGYFLAEGYLGKDDISFCFNSKEENYLVDVRKIMGKLFGITRSRIYQRKNYESLELIFHSKVLNLAFRKLFFGENNVRRASQKSLPFWMLELDPHKQKEILRGWWRGDKGYTTSRLLMNQMKVICLRLGIIPSIGVDSKEDHRLRGKHDKFDGRIITANYDTYSFSNLSFFEDQFGLLKDPIFFGFKTKMKRRRGWIDNQYIYLPIRKIEKQNYEGQVYNLEVDGDNSYTTEFTCVHNCWTPWFSLYGSKSGFDSINECFGGMEKYIYGIETGLSSDPAMNWRIAELDSRSIVSFSDAHSLPKMGREATVFEVEEVEKLKYEDIKEAIMISPSRCAAGATPPGRCRLAYTIEFYPEEGKYHYTGHRNCKVKQNPEETVRLGETCPVCGKHLTVGVMHRVEELASSSVQSPKFKVKSDGFGVKWIMDEGRPPYVMLVPLMEILAEALGTLFGSQKVAEGFEKLIDNFGSEFNVLLKTPTEEIAKISGEKVAEGILRVRSGQVVIDPGYDGVFGTVKIWPSFAKASEGKPDFSTSGTNKNGGQMSLL